MLTLEVIWKDPDVFECRIQAQSEKFAAETNVYFTTQLMQELASAVRGFPARLDDTRRFEIKNSPEANEFALHLRCGDGLGTPVARVSVFDRESLGEQAIVEFTTSATDIDLFERELETIATASEGKATMGSFDVPRPRSA